MSPARKRFAVAAGMPPSAEDVTAPGRLDVPASASAPLDSGRRTAFTWRLTAAQALALDDLMLRLKRELGRPKLDRAEMLAALVDLAATQPAVFAMVVAQLQDA